MFEQDTSTPFHAIFSQYARDAKAQLSAFRFIYDGLRVSPFDSPACIEIKEKEAIDAFTEALGGVNVGIQHT